MTQPDIAVADSLEGRAVAQCAFAHFLNRRLSGRISGDMAELLALAVIGEFAHELERGTPVTPASQLAAVTRAVEGFLKDRGAPVGSSPEVLVDIVCAALTTAETARDTYVQQEKPGTAH